MAISLAVNKTLVKDTVKGIVYVLEIELEDKKLVKIGVTTRKIEERVCEILTSIWHKYRIFPRLYVKRYKSAEDIYGKEAMIHKYLKEYKYKTEKVFSGSTEMFLLPLDKVVEVYDKIIGGKEMICNQYNECPVCGKQERFVVIMEDGTEIQVCADECKLKGDEEECGE